MPGPPPAVPLSEEEHQALHTMIRAHKTPQHLSFRAQIILLWAEGLPAPDVARRLGTTRPTVRRWRRPWLKRHGWAVSERVQDAPRPGAPAPFRAEQWCQSIALAGEPPEASERPISPWTPRALADEARTRGTGATIAERQVGRFFKSGRSHTAQESLRAPGGP
jgi:putative transposase